MKQQKLNAEINTVKISNESEFIQRLQKGDSVSYEILVRNYGGKMLAVARRYFKNNSDAEDCVQDAYIQAFRSIHSFEGRASLYSWLHRIVINAAFMKIRALKRRLKSLLMITRRCLTHRVNGSNWKMKSTCLAKICWWMKKLG
jgi:DNA-directed RNA polymerase specialized sigma24 family protein